MRKFYTTQTGPRWNGFSKVLKHHGDPHSPFSGRSAIALRFLRELLWATYLPVRKASGVTRTIELKMIDSPNPSQEFKL